MRHTIYRGLGEPSHRDLQNVRASCVSSVADDLDKEQTGIYAEEASKPHRYTTVVQNNPPFYGKLHDVISARCRFAAAMDPAPALVCFCTTLSYVENELSSCTAR